MLRLALRAGRKVASAMEVSGANALAVTEAGDHHHLFFNQLNHEFGKI